MVSKIGHHRINSKAAGTGLGFYRIVPLLRREAELVRLAVESGDLDRGTTKRTSQLDLSIESCWDQYTAGTMRTSDFLTTIGTNYGVRM